MNVERRAILVFITLFLLLYILPLCINYMNDRYLLLVLPFLIIALSFAGVDISLKIVFALLLAGAVISVAANHDYMALNRARYEAIKHLMNEEKIPAEQIDGGFEFNAWHFSEKRPYQPSHKGRWWWVSDEEFIISPEKVPGTRLHSQYSFTSFLTISKKNIYVWRKQ